MTVCWDKMLEKCLIKVDFQIYNIDIVDKN